MKKLLVLLLALALPAVSVTALAQAKGAAPAAPGFCAAGGTCPTPMGQQMPALVEKLKQGQLAPEEQKQMAGMMQACPMMQKAATGQPCPMAQQCPMMKPGEAKPGAAQPEGKTGKN